MGANGGKANKGNVLTPANVIAVVAIFALLAGSCVVLWAAAGHGAGSLIAVVHDGEGKQHRLPLQEDAVLTVATSQGTNVVAVKDGAVSIVEADCDGQDCVHQGSISSPGPQIICLPHELWVEVVAEGDAAATEMDPSAVSSTDGVFDAVAR